jgi:hypothetical protein
VTAAPAVAAEPSIVARVSKELLIGGEWRQASTGRRLAVEDPATGRSA